MVRKAKEFHNKATYKQDKQYLYLSNHKLSLGLEI